MQPVDEAIASLRGAVAAEIRHACDDTTNAFISQPLEIHTDPDGKLTNRLPDSWSEKPLCRVMWRDCDESAPAGHPAWQGFCLAEDQAGTVLQDLIDSRMELDARTMLLERLREFEADLDSPSGITEAPNGCRYQVRVDDGDQWVVARRDPGHDEPEIIVGFDRAPFMTRGTAIRWAVADGRTALGHRSLKLCDRPQIV